MTIVDVVITRNIFNEKGYYFTNPMKDLNPGDNPSVIASEETIGEIRMQM